MTLNNEAWVRFVQNPAEGNDAVNDKDQRKMPDNVNKGAA